MNRLLLFAMLALGALSAPASAQQASSAFIVSACGTLPAGVVYAAGQFGIVTMDTTGQLCDGSSGGGGGAVTISAPLVGVSESHSAAAESSRVAKASAGSVVSISGSGASGSYIMLFDATSAPADGAVSPKKCWGPLASAGPFALSWGIGPVLTMGTGITVVSSSTGCFTKTATNANFLSVEYQ